MKKGNLRRLAEFHKESARVHAVYRSQALFELQELRQQLKDADEKIAIIQEQREVLERGSAELVLSLRAQLAERDALMRDQSGKLIVLASRLLQEPLRVLNRDLDSEGAITRIKVTDGVERASDSLGGLAMEIRRVADALSASAEPSAPTCPHQRAGECWAKPGEPPCHGCEK